MVIGLQKLRFNKQHMRAIIIVFYSLSYLTITAQPDLEGLEGLKQKTQTIYYADGQINRKIISYYSPKGILERQEIVSDNAIWQSTEYFISDESGRCQKTYTTDDLGQVSDSVVYTYYDDDRLKRQDRYFPQRESVHYEEFSYITDEQGHVLEEHQLYLGKPSWIYYHEYDENGLHLSQLSTYPRMDSLTSSLVYENQEQLDYTYANQLFTQLKLTDWLEGYPRENTTWKYTYEGELLVGEEAESWHFGRNEFAYSKTLYTYDFGRLIKEVRYNEGVLEQYSEYMYEWW